MVPRLYMSTEIEFRVLESGEMVLWDIEDSRAILTLTQGAAEAWLTQAIEVWDQSLTRFTENVKAFNAKRAAESAANGGGKKPPPRRSKKK